MDAQMIADRMSIEENILAHVRDALEVAVSAPIVRTTAVQWLERFCFLGNSFQRHLRRLFAIEEEGGYMDFIISCPQPTLGNQADSLHTDHQDLPTELESILADAADIDPSDLDGLRNLRERLEGFLERLSSHHRREHDLWLDAFLVDIGGEG
jgi:hypothetical protein